jgi:hypothetical protein
MKKIITQEIYNENRLIETKEFEVEDTLDQDIVQKEELLLKIYKELSELKAQKEAS